jgi:hypothetical protein
MWAIKRMNWMDIYMRRFSNHSVKKLNSIIKQHAQCYSKLTKIQRERDKKMSEKGRQEERRS